MKACGRKDLRVCLTMWAPGEGGLQSKAQTVYRYLTARGFSVTLLYLGSPLSLKRFPGWLWNGGVRREDWMGMPGIAADYMAHVELLHYLIPAIRVRPLLRNFDIFLATRGANLGETFFALNGKRFIDWVSSTIPDERRVNPKSPSDPLTSLRLLGWVNRLLFPALMRQEAWMLRRAARVLAVSAYTARLITETYGISSTRVETVHDPVDTDVFHPSDGVRRTDMGRYLLCVGRLDDPRKNLELLLEAFSLVHGKRPEVRLLLVGPARDPDALRAKTRRLGVEAAVTYVGPVRLDRRSDLVRLYQGAEALVLSSTQETFGRVLAEAMACETPVVATRCGAPEEVVQDGENGFLVPSGDSTAMAEAILRIVDDPGLRERMGQAGRESVLANFAIDIVGKRLVDSFRRVYPDLLE